MSQAVVVGGSLSGLMSALLLARAGWHVTVVERDPLPVDGDPESAWAAWPRPAVPQTGHSHNFFARVRVELASHAPDVLARMHAAGIEDLRITDHAPPAVAGGLSPGANDELVALIGRRSTFEWALRRAALDEPGVTVLVGDVDGLVVERGTPPRVTGVRLADATLGADLVIDASGRRSRVGEWLAASRGKPLDFDSVDCGITYFTRYYRLRAPDASWPPLTRGFGGGANFPTHVAVAFPADRDIYSVTLGVPPWVEELRSLREPTAFEAVTGLSPASAAWGENGVGEPITDVRVMAGVRNGIRRDAAVTPPAIGLALVGDAFMHSNPALARGVSLAVVGAVRLARAVTEHPDATELAQAWTTELAALAADYYYDVLDRDIDRAELWSATWEGRVPQVPPVAEDVRFAEIVRGSAVDPAVWRALQRASNLLDPPSAAWAPDVLGRVRELRDADAWPPLPPVPTADEVIAAAGS